VKSVRPDVLVAASPHADYRFSLNERGQDWHGWLRDGYMDYVTPLTYGDDNWVRKYLGQWQETDYFPGRIVPRLSVCSFNPTTPKPTSSVLRQIQIGSDAGATGTTLWDDRYICQNSSLVRALGAGGW
jgi:hypothetical protein